MGRQEIEQREEEDCEIKLIENGMIEDGWCMSQLWEDRRLNKEKKKEVEECEIKVIANGMIEEEDGGCRNQQCEDRRWNKEKEEEGERRRSRRV